MVEAFGINTATMIALAVGIAVGVMWRAIK
jgi:hypothetical protein